MKLSAGIPELHVSRKTADLLTAEVGNEGATVVGRRLYDLTNGWDGHPGGEVPMVVVTRHPPRDWPRDGVPIFFESSVEAAVAKARELAGDQDVSIAGATVTRGCLDAGLLDAIQVSLVPVILGRGIPWLAGTRGPECRRTARIVERVGGLSDRMLAARLKELEQLGLIDRIVEPTTPVSVRYRLTVRGQDLLASLQPLVAYGQRWEKAPEANQAPEVSQPDQPGLHQPGR